MNKELLEKLAELADTLDNNGHIKEAEDIDAFIGDMAKVMKKLEDRRQEEIVGLDAGDLVKCPKCEGHGGTDEEPICSACKGEGFFVLAQEESLGIIKNAFIRRRKGKWCVISKKGKTLGCYTSRKAAVKRLRQIEFFKHNK